MAPDTWATQAACRTWETGVWHGDDITAGLPRRRHEAWQVSICHTCPVESECLAWATGPDDPAKHLVAGGQTYSERSGRNVWRRGRREVAA